MVPAQGLALHRLMSVSLMKPWSVVVCALAEDAKAKTAAAATITTMRRT